MTDKSEKDKNLPKIPVRQLREKALDELTQQAQELGLYDTQMNIANKVMEEDKEVLKELTND